MLPPSPRRCAPNNCGMFLGMTLVRIAGSRSFAGSKLVEVISLSWSLRQLSLVMDQALEEAGIDEAQTVAALHERKAARLGK